MALRRDVTRTLLRVWDDERAFADLIRSHIEAGRMKKKEAEKTVISYYQEPYRLRQKFYQTLEGWGM
jgi:hypothetical protein